MWFVYITQLNGVRNATKKGTREMNPLVTNLEEEYVMSQKDVAEKMFLHINTVGNIEKRAIQKFKEKLAERNLTINDLL